MIALRALAPYAKPTPEAKPTCELCGVAIAEPHRHVIEIAEGPRGVRCACTACAVLFDHSASPFGDAASRGNARLGDHSASPLGDAASRGNAPPGARAGSRFRTVPDRVRSDPAFALTPVELGIPVGLAFVVRTGGATLVGYPGPAGITDGELADDVWARLAAATPLARELVEHVEALLVYGERGAQRLACYLVPVTHAYELAARLRATWSGIAGGDTAHAELAAFFAMLDRGSR